MAWEKIKVNDGPKSLGMHEVLKAAIRSLKELDETILNNAKEQYAGQYDLVQPVFGGVVSLHKDDYAAFAKAMGTVKDQPGYLVDQILIRVNQMLHELCSKYSVTQTQTQQRRFGN